MSTYNIKVMYNSGNLRTLFHVAELTFTVSWILCSNCATTLSVHRYQMDLGAHATFFF